MISLQDGTLPFQWSEDLSREGHPVHSCWLSGCLLIHLLAGLSISLESGYTEYLYLFYRCSFSQTQNASATSTTAWSLRSLPGQQCTGSNTRRYCTDHLKYGAWSVRFWCGFQSAVGSSGSYHLLPFMIKWLYYFIQMHWWFLIIVCLYINGYTTLFRCIANFSNG